MNMAEFAFKKLFFEFNGSVKQQVSGMVIVQSVFPFMSVYTCMKQKLNS